MVKGLILEIKGSPRGRQKESQDEAQTPLLHTRKHSRCTHTLHGDCPPYLRAEHPSWWPPCYASLSASAHLPGKWSSFADCVSPLKKKKSKKCEKKKRTGEMSSVTEMQKWHCLRELQDWLNACSTLFNCLLLPSPGAPLWVTATWQLSAGEGQHEDRAWGPLHENTQTSRRGRTMDTHFPFT